ncbi:MAG TPA: hypothetical protein VGF23_08640 [Gaiellaceae bacterium]
MLEYERIAARAPGLLHGEQILPQHAQRFVVHWLVGTISDVTGAPLHATYRVAAVIVLVLIALVVDRILAAREVGPSTYAVCMGALVTSPYLFRFDLIAPGMIADATFALGAALTLLGLVRGRFGSTAAGLAIAAVSRGDTTSGLVIVVVAWVLLGPEWRLGRTAGRRVAEAVGLAAVAIAAGAATYAVGDGFSKQGDVHGFRSFTLVGTLLDLPGSARGLGEHVVRIWVGVAPPLALVAGALVVAAATGRLRAFSFAAWASLAFGLVVLAETFVINPGWLQGSEPRLASFGLAPLVAAAGLLLGELEEAGTWRWSGAATAVVLLGVAIGSLHHNYVEPRIVTTAGAFFALELVATAVILAPFVRSATARRRDARESPACA